MNLPNKLTVARIVLVPVFMVLVSLGQYGTPSYESWQYLAAGVVFAVASFTDYLDGHIARSRNQVTNFGKFADPLADKMLVFAALIWFTAQGLFPAWAMVVVAAREFAVTGLRLVAVGEGRVIAAAKSGKIKTASTMVCIILMFMPIPMWVYYVCTAVIVITTVYSGVEYFIKNKDVIALI